MRKLIVIVAVVVAVTLSAAWVFGGFDWLQYHAVAVQREFQVALAGAIRRLKANQPGAVLGLIGLCFGYGVIHAAGPGHGKMLVGGYALANRIKVLRLVALTVAASLGQAATAVVLVYGGVFLFNWSRERMVGLAEVTLTAASYAAIGAIGLYLIWRGVRMLATTLQTEKAGDALRVQNAGGAGSESTGGHKGHHVAEFGTPKDAVNFAPQGDLLPSLLDANVSGRDSHEHVHDEHCGHVHGPTLAQIDRLHGVRDAALLIAGVAIRPCTGAIFLLILCWRIGANLAGIAGAFAMGLGTATITVTAAVLAVTMREGAWASGLDTLAMRRVMGITGIGAGAVLAFTSAMMLRFYL